MAKKRRKRVVRKRRTRSNPARKRRRISGARKSRPTVYRKGRKIYGSASGYIKRGTRINPSRKRRRYRSNPSLLKGFNLKGILRQVKPMALGAIGGIAVNYGLNMLNLSANIKPWAKLGTAIALPMVFKKGVLGDSAKYGAIVVGASAIRDLVSVYFPSLAIPLSGDAYAIDDGLMGSQQLMYGDDYADLDYGDIGSEQLMY